MDEFKNGMRRRSVFVRYTAKGSDLPLSWKDAVRRQNEVLAKGQG